MNGNANPWLRPWAPREAADVRLFCFPHAGGAASFYRSWAKVLPPWVELLAVQYPGREDRLREPAIDDMSAMVAEVVEAMGPWLDRRVVLFGHSMGAAIAYEVARDLEGRSPGALEHLMVSGRPGPRHHRSGRKHLGSDDDLWAEIGSLGGTSREVLASREMQAVLLPTLRRDYRLVESWRPDAHAAPLRCPILVCLGTADVHVSPVQAEAWAETTEQGSVVHVFEGNHFYLLRHRRKLVDLIVRTIAGAGAATAP